MRVDDTAARLLEAIIGHFDETWGVKLTVRQAVALAWDGVGRGQAFQAYNVRMRSKVVVNADIAITVTKRTKKEIAAYAASLGVRQGPVLRYVLDTFARSIVAKEYPRAIMVPDADLPDVVSALHPEERVPRSITLAAPQRIDQPIRRRGSFDTENLADLDAATWPSTKMAEFNKWIQDHSPSSRWKLKVYSTPDFGEETPWAWYGAVLLWEGSRAYLLFDEMGPVSSPADPFPRIPPGARIMAWKIRRHIDWNASINDPSGRAGQYLPSRSERTLQKLGR